MASKFVKQVLEQHLDITRQTILANSELLLCIAEVAVEALRRGSKLMFCGNGGSAADSQHIAAEFVNRFKLERNPLPAIALTTDTSILTAISNDYSYKDVFLKQVQALGREGDMLFGISTSGTSINVIKALEWGRGNGLITVGFAGENTEAMKSCCHYVFSVHSGDTPRIQEVHILAAHILCEMIERSFFNE